MIQWGELVPFSVQCIIDCAWRDVKEPGNPRVVHRVKDKGCESGFIWNVHQHVMIHGLILEKDYPRRWIWGQGRCLDAGKDIAATILGWDLIVKPTEKKLMRDVARQPVAVAVDHFPKAKSYTGGVIGIDDWPPATEEKDTHVHAVLVVGYGTDPSSGRKCWKVKDSQGTVWGDGFLLS